MASKAPRRDPAAVLKAAQAAERSEEENNDKGPCIVDLEQETEDGNTPNAEDQTVAPAQREGKRYVYIIISSVADKYNDYIYDVSDTVYASLEAANAAAKDFELDYGFSSHVKGKEVYDQWTTDDGRWGCKMSAGGAETVTVEVLKREMQVDVPVKDAVTIKTHIRGVREEEPREQITKSTMDEQAIEDSTTSTSKPDTSTPREKDADSCVYVIASTLTDPYNDDIHEVSEYVYVDLATANEAARCFGEKYECWTNQGDESEEWMTDDGRWGADMDGGEGVILKVEVLRREIVGNDTTGVREKGPCRLIPKSEDKDKAQPLPPVTENSMQENGSGPYYNITSQTTDPTKQQHASIADRAIYVVTREAKSNDYNSYLEPLQVVGVYDSLQKANQAARELLRKEGWENSNDEDYGSGSDKVQWDERMGTGGTLKIYAEFTNTKSLSIEVEAWQVQ